MLKLAKPDGTTYETHVSDVKDMVRHLEDLWAITATKYAKMTHKNDLFDTTFIAAEYHDEGKLHPAWQEPCQRDYAAFQQWLTTQEVPRTAQEFERENRDLAGANLRKANFRHEIGSLIMHEDNKSLTLRTLVAIGAHHAKLALEHEEKWKAEKLQGKAHKYYKKFKLEQGKVSGFPQVLEKFYMYAGPRALLQIADRRASAMEGKTPHPAIVPFDYTFPANWNKKIVQKIAESQSDRPLLLLRAPTGAGKTDASLLWANKQICAGRAQKLVIAMPTRFTSTALALGAENTISDVGLYHSSARFVERAGMKGKSRADRESLMLYSKWLMSPVTVCTIDHLLMSLTLTREEHHITLFNLSNSCLVNDEADAYDDFIRHNIAVLLKACTKWEVPVLLMSATLAERDLKFFKEKGIAVDSIEEDASEKDVIQCQLSSIREYEAPNDIEDLIQRCVEKKTAIIYVNTVARAISLYRYICNYQQELPVFLYHAQFIETDKMSREKDILDCLGKKAWETGSARGIVIMTQIGEMSINISAEIMLSELCPIDRLVQRVGRLCRFEQNRGIVGELHLVIPHQKGVFYPAPYGNYIKGKGWIPNLYLERTRDILYKGTYKKGDWVRLLETVYSVDPPVAYEARSNGNKLEELFEQNWLVRQTAITNDDDTSTNGWKARSMEPQRMAILEEPNEEGCFHFASWNEYYALQSEKGISFPIYRAEKAIKAGCIIPFSMKMKGQPREEKVFMIEPRYYSRTIGFDMGMAGSDEHII